MSKDPIAAGIRSLMSERGLIQKAVAFRAGYTQQQFNDMLRRVGRSVASSRRMILPVSAY